MKKNKFNMLWRRVIPISVTFIVSGLTSLLIWQWLAVGCLWWECVDSGIFEPQEIQLPRDFFPDEAAYGSLGPEHTAYGAKQHHAQQIFWDEPNNYISTAILDVYRYFGLYGAQKRYSSLVRIFGDFYTSSDKDNSLKYESISADQLFIKCGEMKPPLGYRCTFIARYGEDLISLSMTVGEQMTLKDFEQIITYLDTVSAERLGH